MRTFLARGTQWVREHPTITATLGAGLTAAAAYYGGPAGAELAGKALPFLCDTLKLCA